MLWPTGANPVWPKGSKLHGFSSWLPYVSCDPISRFREIGNTFVRTKVQLAKQGQMCYNGEISVFRENVRERDREITKS